MTVAANPNRISWIELASRPICDVPWLGTSIVLSDGTVNFCCFSSDAKIGNVNDEPLERIWNGPVMQEIRRSLTEQKLPPQCESISCPIFRGDKLNYLLGRMQGDYRFEKTGTHDPHAYMRERLQGSSLRVTKSEPDEVVELEVELQYQGDPNSGDLFVAVRAPDGAFRFFPNGEDYAVPFFTEIELNAAQSPMRFAAYGQLEWFRVVGEYEACAALFVRGSSPNLLSNCYWSSIQPFTKTNHAARLAELRRRIS